MIAKRLVVTGGSGFIGTAVIERAAVLGYEVTNLDAAAPRNPAHAHYWRRLDLLDAAQVSAAVADLRPDLIIHLAARTDLGGRTVGDYAVNVRGVENLLAAIALQPQVERVVLASSMLVCRLGYQPATPDDFCPNTVYGESKAAGERLVRASDPGGERLVLARLTSIWGPWFRAPYRTFFDYVRRGLYIHPAGASVRRSYGYVENIAWQLMALLEAPREQLDAAPYYLGDYEPVDILTWANEIASTSGRPPIRVVPKALLALAAAAGDALQRLGWRDPPMTSFRLHNMLADAVYDTRPVAALCPTLPVDRLTGVARTIAWLDGPGRTDG